jgi:hypothetical protein
MRCNRTAMRRHLVVDKEGEVREATPDEFALWAKQAGSDDQTLAAVLLGFVHIWDFGTGSVVSLDPRRLNPITMTSAIDVVARLGREWTVVSSLAPGGRAALFTDRRMAICQIELLMEEAGTIEPYLGYDGLLTEAARFLKVAHSDC